MPHTDCQLQYSIKLTAREFRLVTLALSQKLKDNPDIREALALNAHLCQQRVTHLKSQLEQAQKAEEHAIELNAEQEPE